MERLYTNILGTPVFEDDGTRPITTVKDLLVDPETSKTLAFIVDKSKNLVVMPIDIVSFGDVIRINTHDSIIEAHEVLRIEQVQQKQIYIFNNRVETEEGEYLGRVIDFSLDFTTYELKKIYVAKVILGMFRYGTRVFTVRNIVEILPKKIVVKGGPEKVIEKSVEREVMTA